MKLTAILMTIACLQVSAKALSQISLSGKHITLSSVFTDIQKQSGYTFFYKDNIVANIAVNADLHNATLDQAMKQVLAGLPLTYNIVDKTVVIRQSEPSLIDKLKIALNIPITVTGKVLDETGQLLPGVTVKIKDTNLATVTDGKGAYSISIPDNNAILVFSFIGYETQELAAKDIPAGSVIKLKAAETNLKEVVISKGYYDEKRELSTGDVGIITSKQISEQSISDPILSLEGRISGIQISQSTGASGAATTIQIRGQNSIRQGNDPLVVVDGVPFINKSDFENTIRGASTGISPFNSINPGDIETIEVLKDADATAIYGSRGANGVILITTKRGASGSTRVDLNVNEGIGQVNRTANLLNTPQYLQMRHEAFKNDGLTSSSPEFATAYDINGTWDTTRYTNWQKLMLGNTSHYTDVQASISGGNTNTQFLIGTGLHRESTVYPGDFADEKGSLHLNLANTSTNQKFKTNLSVFFTEDNNQLPSQDLSSVTFLPPDAPSIYDSNGKLNWQNSTFTNPYALLLQRSKNVTDNVNLNLNLSYQILSGLEIKANIGVNDMWVNSLHTTPQSSINPAQTYILPSAVYGDSEFKSWIFEPQITYSKPIGKGKLETLIGGTFSNQTQNSVIQTGTGYVSDALLETIQAAQTTAVNSDTYSQYRYESIYGRLSYNWNSKYLLNLTGRRDGSTRFGPGRQYGNFGAVGAGWIFSKEGFIENNLPFISFGKLRASYGITGNDQIGNYQYLNTYTSYFQNYQGIVPLYPVGLSNSNYAWEVNKKFEIGLDLSLFKDRISISTDYYRNRSSNQLVQYTEPAITGFTGVIKNFPAVVQNTGLEFTINTSNIKSNNFKWNSSFNLTIPHNKLIAFPDIATSAYATSYEVGQPLNIQKVYKSTGVNPQTGLYTFQDYNNDGQITSPEDKQAVVFFGQQYYGGLQNNLQLKNWRLDFFFQYVKQDNGYSPLINSMPGTMNNQLTYVLNRWQSPGNGSNMQMFSNSNSAAYQAFSNYSFSNAAYVSTSYVRLKTVSLSYQLPDKWIQSLHIKNASLQLQGQNLLTFTKYPGLDPETGGLMPLIRIITAGFKVGL